MFSLQRVLGRDDEFCALLEASAAEGVRVVQALRQVTEQSATRPTLTAFREARRQNKKIMEELATLQYFAIVTSLEREDIEAMAEALYKIPKTVEKFAERYLLSFDKVRPFDFTRQLVLMEEATRSVLEMMGAFRASAGIAEIKRLDARIQRLENEADDVVIQFVARLVDPEFPSLQAIILKDLVELNEKVVDRCRDASGVVARVTMKIS